jgi:hypothetical protein
MADSCCDRLKELEDALENIHWSVVRDLSDDQLQQSAEIEVRFMINYPNIYKSIKGAQAVIDFRPYGGDFD